MSTRDDAGPLTAPTGLTDGWLRRRERVAERIEAVALQLFADRGYRNVTVAEVAAAAGISARTAARYFPAKEDLLLAMPRRAAQQAVAQLRAAGSQHHTVQEIWETWAQLARDHRADVQLLGLWWRAASQVPEAVARASGEQHLVVQRELTRAVLVALGDSPDAAFRARTLAAALHAANQSVVEYWLEHQDRDLVELFSSATSALSDQVGRLDRPAARRRPAPGGARRRPAAPEQDL
ncbi:MAG: putative TetR family transcriptional regulator [Frankiales bacterium]|nr:putative TetR family transcriptional regulator [Frankiales bacterium]